MEKPQLRAIFHDDENPTYWREATAQFPNKIPRFASKDDAIKFTKTYCIKKSNPYDNQLQHSITTLTSWNQIENCLLPKMREYNDRWAPVSPVDISVEENRFYIDSNDHREDSNPVHECLLGRLDLSIHRDMTSISTLNTLKYLFYHMKCGILVMIRDNKVVIFCPFVNKDYINAWGDCPKIDAKDDNLVSYYERKSHEYRHEKIIDKRRWWANGNIICNEEDSQGWGDHFLLQLKDMISETCRERSIPDCDFFINKRDYPQLKFNGAFGPQGTGQPVEPYGFIFDKDDRDPTQDIPLSRHLYKSYAPILSFYSSERFADIPIPPSEDWETATGDVFPSSFILSIGKDKGKEGGENEVNVAVPRDLYTSQNLKKFEVPWADKVATAFFRGTASGGGVTIETNQRLHLAQLSYMWSLVKPAAQPPHLDAKIVGWNMRDKKIAGTGMTFIRKDNFPFKGDRKTNFVEIYRQSTFKYLLYVEGHCAACRYGFMMLLGSVILKVKSKCVADKMWYFPLLRPFVDHVPVNADLSDLIEKIEWCRSHDEECRKIATRARQLHDQFISRDAILDYMQAVFLETSRRFHRPPDWALGILEDGKTAAGRGVLYTAAGRAAPQSRQAHNACYDEDGLCACCEKRKKLETHMLSQPIPQTAKIVTEQDVAKAKKLELRQKKRLADIEEAMKKKAAVEEVMKKKAAVEEAAAVDIQRGTGHVVEAIHINKKRKLNTTS